MACYFCGDQVAPFGFQQPGPFRDRTDKRRIWTCLTHIQDGEARWREHFKATPRTEERQQGLFGQTR